jgi:squalene-associated FAD-dependent desaturase
MAQDLDRLALWLLVSADDDGRGMKRDLSEKARVHVIGAGVAGLAAAMCLSRAGHPVTLYEAAQQAGGRCRSYHDAELDCRLDNGNHLIVTGNLAAMAYLTEIDAASTVVTQDMAVFPFIDVGTGERWTVRPTEGRFPWWIFLKDRRVAGSKVSDYLSALKLQRAGANTTIAQCFDQNSLLYRRLWGPLTVAVLNTEAATASAQLLWSIFAQTFGRGGAALHAVLPKIGLSETLVDPALQMLAKRGGEIRYGHRLRALTMADKRVTLLDFGKTVIDLAPGERVVLAVTPSVATDLLPGTSAPDSFRAIVNAHYRCDDVKGEPGFLGVIGGTAEWIFQKPGILSVTCSAAEALVDRPAEDLAKIIWRDVAKACNRDPETLPRWRVVKEKRATFAATPEQLAKRPGCKTDYANLWLAGDWTATGWPATIEGAIRSGFTAADAMLL